jgi:prophage antirepressor-like protein
MNNEEKSNLVLFDGQQIRKLFHAGEWWFSIIDVVDVLVGGDRARKYWSDLKKKLGDEGYVELSEKIGQLKMLAPDGKMRQTDVADTEQLFRLIQSIPSPKAEPFKLWLAQEASERLDEMQDPEMTVD